MGDVGEILRLNSPYYTVCFGIIKFDYLEKLPKEATMKFCKKCILPESYPGISFNNEGICNYCVDYKPYHKYVGKEKLINLADINNLKIMVDHTFLFTGAVRKMREIIDSRELGSLRWTPKTGQSVIWAQFNRFIMSPHYFEFVN